MFRSTFLTVFLFSTFSIGKLAAQDVSLFAGGNIIVGFPTGDFKNGYKRATGIEASLGAGTKRVILLGTVGYTSYKEQDGNNFGKITAVPIKGGIRLYPSNIIFLTGNAGVALLKDETMSSRESRFTYDAGIGLHFILGQVSVHYDAWKRKNNPGYSSSIQLKFGLAIK